MWRWIKPFQAEGAVQMALDTLLLERSGKDNLPIMRVYSWQPWCISLGYNQPAEQIDENVCRREQVDIARRPTGGRAVFHSQEITYCVIIPRESRFYQESLPRLYSLISEGLARGLRLLSIPATLQKRSLNMRTHYRGDESVNCFSAAARSEILVQGKKMVGSAQRHLSWGMLQHGSILKGTAHRNLAFFTGTGDRKKQERLRKITEKKTTEIDSVSSSPLSDAEVTAGLKKGMAEVWKIGFEDVCRS